MAIYGKPTSGTPSSIGPQLRTDHYQKEALIEIRKEQYFSQLADMTSMPKNMGKKIVRFHYLPLLDARNMNDQGIDAAGAVIATTGYDVTLPRLVQVFADASAATAAAAAINAISAGTATASTVTVTSNKVALGITTLSLSTTLSAAVPGATVKQGSGNLYGSSKDIGTISGKMPVLSETGGRVNRVGYKRKTLEGTFENFGFFDEYTRDSVDFDTDSGLQSHIHREMLNGANEMTEDALQIDIINSAGVIKYAGAAMNNAGMGTTNLVSYGDLMRLSIDLDNNRTPKHTTISTGTRMIDTRVIPAARAMYIGSELLPTLKAMKDLHNNAAFISVEKYAAGGTTMTGEVGSIDNFRLIVVPEMMKWSGGGGPVTDATCYDNGAFYDVFPMLVVGGESFTTIGFQTDGKTVKFKIMQKAPGEATADRNDPYGKMGFMSIEWYYGFMVLRPERIACLRTVAKL